MANLTNYNPLTPTPVAQPENVGKGQYDEEHPGTLGNNVKKVETQAYSWAENDSPAKKGKGAE